LTRGKVIDTTPTGYWEWFRKDGTKMRSGFFENDEPIGDWTTYDKVTRMKPTNL
jgi:hypothetical protein